MNDFSDAFVAVVQTDVHTPISQAYANVTILRLLYKQWWRKICLWDKVAFVYFCRDKVIKNWAHSLKSKKRHWFTDLNIYSFLCIWL